MEGKAIYIEQIKPLIDNYRSKETEMSKSIINETMGSIIPIVKEVYHYVSKNKPNKDPYLKGIYEAYVKNPGISVRTINTQKINSLLFDIESYICFHTRN